MSKRMYHPCHKLSVPSAKLFWCRHCMQMFEDAITRWKHSKKCHASPGFKPKDQDAKVVQLYVKPDTVSYTSNVKPGESVFYKPHVKKTSADLKCVICGTKFQTLYDMRMHVKEPCQKSDFNSVASTQFDFEDRKDSPRLKIRRVESESEDKLNTSTALSVLAEASKHVESLYQGEVVLEQVIEEEVPQVIENFPGTDGTIIQGVTSPEIIAGETQQVVVAYPKPAAKPELGVVVVVLQSEDGNQISHDTLDIDFIQECLKPTAESLPAGQVLQIQFEKSDKILHFVVGNQGVILPYQDSHSVHTTEKQEQTANTLLEHRFAPVNQAENTRLVEKSSLAPVSVNCESESTLSEAAACSDLQTLNSEKLNWQVLTSVLQGQTPVQLPDSEILKSGQTVSVYKGSDQRGKFIVLTSGSDPPAVPQSQSGQGLVLAGNTIQQTSGNTTLLHRLLTHLNQHSTVRPSVDCGTISSVLPVVNLQSVTDTEKRVSSPGEIIIESLQEDTTSDQHLNQTVICTDSSTSVSKVQFTHSVLDSDTGINLWPSGKQDLAHSGIPAQSSCEAVSGLDSIPLKEGSNYLVAGGQLQTSQAESSSSPSDLSKTDVESSQVDKVTQA